MTEQEITQARDDLEQLDIEQLRCGVMLQLLKIEALTKERDDAVYACGLVVQRCDRLVIERDALAAAGELAFKALCRINDVPIHLDHGERLSLAKAIAALRQAGVQ